MKQKLTILALLCAMACNPGGLRSGDLIFVATSAEAGSMDEAISSATGNITHVAIAEVSSGSIWVIDSAPDGGVSRHPLDTFVKRLSPQDSLIVKRVRGIDANAAVERAKTYIGQAYDFRFLPDNNDIYCSELVQKSYLDASGKQVFHSEPMNFKAPDGTMPSYWEELFGGLGMDVPQGVPGTNPNKMSQAGCLEDVHWRPAVNGQY